MRPIMLLGPLSNAFASLTYAPIPRGCIELPTAYGEHVWGLMKGRPTKYIKRVPKPGGGFRYFYDAGHGGGVHAQEHMVEGARFRHGEGHFHVVKSEGDTLHVRNSATGEEHTITKQALSKKLAEHHAEGIKAYRDRASKALAEAKANKASPKQIARLEERVKRAGGKETPKTEPEGKPVDHNALSKIWHSYADSTSWDRSPSKTERLYGLIKKEIASTKARPDYRGKEGMLTSLRSDLLAVSAHRKAIGSKPSDHKDADAPRPSSSPARQAEQPPSGFKPLTRESASKVDVGATLTLFNPAVGIPAEVQYRGRIGDDAHVLINGMGANVPLEQLSAKPAPAPKPSAAASQSKAAKPPTRFDRSYEAQQKPSGKPPSATSMGKQEFIDAKSQELRKKQADVLAGIERSIADTHPGPYKYGMTPVQSLQFEKNVTPSQQKLLTDWRLAKKAASEDITMARSTFGHAWDQHNKPKDKTAEATA